MPERPWASLARRAGFATAALLVTAAFGFSLVAIARTEGRVQPHGPAAALAAERARSAVTGAAARHRCHRGEGRRGGNGLSGPV